MTIIKVNNLDEWRKIVKQRDGNVCRRCGFRSNLHGHHIMPKEKYPEFELELDNGIALCGNCHSLLKGKEVQINLRVFLFSDEAIDTQLESVIEMVTPRFECAEKEVQERIDETKLSLNKTIDADFFEAVDNLNQAVEKFNRYKEALDNLSKVMDAYETENNPVISQIKLMYRDAYGVSRTVIKRIWEERLGGKWVVKKIEIIYENGECIPSVESSQGWNIPQEWKFQSETTMYWRKQEGVVYDHDSEVGLSDET